MRDQELAFAIGERIMGWKCDHDMPGDGVSLWFEKNELEGQRFNPMQNDEDAVALMRQLAKMGYSVLIYYSSAQERWEVSMIRTQEVGTRYCHGNFNRALCYATISLLVDHAEEEED